MTTLQQLLPMVLSRKKLLESGVSAYTIRKRLIRRELLEIRKGFYIEAEKAQPLTSWEQDDLRILTYSLKNPEAVFSHESAARLHDLPLIRAARQVHIYANPHSRGQVLGVKKHFCLEASTPVDLKYGRKVTGLATTLLDCVSTMPKEDAVVLADAALHRNLVSEEILRSVLTAYRGRNSSVVHAVARDMSGLAESPGESLVRLLLLDMNIIFEEQRWFETESKRYRVDFYLPEYGIVVEFDGSMKYTSFGSTDSALMSERFREADLQNLGLLVFRTRWESVFTTPEMFKSGIRECIRRARRRAAT